MIIGTLIKKKISAGEISEKIKKYSKEKIECTPHSFFRFSEEQRKIFNCEFVKTFLLEKVPALAGQQFNDNYALFYDFESGTFLKVIILFRLGKVVVITFYTIDRQHLPKM